VAETNGDNRATIALVSAKIDGLVALQQANFENLQGQLDRRLGAIHEELGRLNDLPVKVAHLEGDMTDLKSRLKRIEDGKDADAEWRRGPAVLALVALLTTVLNILISAGAIHLG
jgi:hypothetical protein